MTVLLAVCSTCPSVHMGKVKCKGRSEGKGGGEPPLVVQTRESSAATCTSTPLPNNKDRGGHEDGIGTEPF